ncbi:hypothetical protein [Citrobacter sp. wls613]|uniref:hypothetical protein n=1 Tax=Citrobacter sp. wls613 TaxID=2576436 RepID=UPI0010CA8E5B|nr:hypothetical protein [Citrobacter sp. wls613]TKV19563.1 hypothetical protein FDX01_14665 [Citrobacter sp. wls613]
MSSRENIERWVSEIDEDGMCDISDNQVTALIRDYNCMAVQLANAESKCRELAAENEKQLTHSEALAVDNAALREVVERMVNQFAMSGISPEEKSINPAKSLMFDAKSALFMPTTDAFLAEVRASGVEIYAEHLTRKAIASGENKNHAYAYLAANFAAQLRKGVQS